jgi:hypothetical protein
MSENPDWSKSTIWNRRRLLQMGLAGGGLIGSSVILRMVNSYNNAVKIPLTSD